MGTRRDCGTMARAELSVANISKTLGKAEFWDKFLRILQFVSLGLTGLTDLAKPAKGTRLWTVHRTAWHLFFQFSLTRRSHRFFKGFIFSTKMSDGLKTANGPFDVACEVLQNAFIQIFFCIDHYAWLKQVRLLPSPPTPRGKARGMETVYFGV